jgi:heme/copper-type cytochrome/quinol oxidase subunit 4
MRVLLTCNLTPYILLTCFILSGYAIYTSYAVYTWGWDAKCSESHTIFQNACIAILCLITNIIFLMYLVMIPSSPTNRQTTICSVLYMVAFCATVGSTWVFYDSGFYRILSSHAYPASCNHQYIIVTYAGVILAILPIYISVCGFLVYLVSQLVNWFIKPAHQTRTITNSITQTNPGFINPKFDINEQSSDVPVWRHKPSIDLSWHGEDSSNDGDSREYLIK